MRDYNKKPWNRPEVILISRKNEIHGGAAVASREIHTGNNKISTTAHGGSGTVPTAIYDNAMS
jgi:hypothetical protein